MTRRRLLFAVPREYGRAVSPRSTALAALAAALVPVASAQAIELVDQHRARKWADA